MTENSGNDDEYKNEEPVTDWVNQRSVARGRRKDDETKCAMHDYCFETSQRCMDVIKMTIAEEVKKRDHKFEILEKRLENFISKWAMGVIVTTCTFFLGIIFSVGAWQLSTLRSDIYNLRVEISDFREIQIGVLKELGHITPEHEQLMDLWKKGTNP